MLPPSDGGLHCGQQAMLNPMLGRLVFPPFSGESEDHTERWVYRVLPPFSGGLHCGHGYTVNLPEDWAGAPAV